MAGAQLKFEGGYLGIERCENPDDGKQYLRAVIHRNANAMTTSAPVEIDAVLLFGMECLKQAALARDENLAFAPGD